MENMYFNSRDEYKNFLESHVVRRIGSPGREGTCSLLDNGMVVKSLYCEYYPGFALQFKDFDIPSFVFAKSGAFIGGSVVGLFMDYADGHSIKDHKPSDQKIITLGTQLDTVVHDIKTASDAGIVAKDFHCGNIMYDYNKFRIIDTLSYLLLNNSHFEKENIYEIMNKLYQGLLGDLLKHREVWKKFSFWGNLEYLENPKEYLLAIKAFIEELAQREITTLQEAEMTLKKVK